jgi:hypothetical protein
LFTVAQIEGKFSWSVEVNMTAKGNVGGVGWNDDAASCSFSPLAKLNYLGRRQEPPSRYWRRCLFEKTHAAASPPKLKLTFQNPDSSNLKILRYLMKAITAPSSRRQRLCEGGNLCKPPWKQWGKIDSLAESKREGVKTRISGTHAVLFKLGRGDRMNPTFLNSTTFSQRQSNIENHSTTTPSPFAPSA